MQIADARHNTAFLRRRFVERLLAERPESVLDVGCGGGELLDLLTQAGVPATGLEASPQRLAHLQARDVSVLSGSAEHLPLGEGAFDWLTLRHVPHHLEDPAAAFAEALRVCRTGVLIAEPWFDPSHASQRLALDHDRWLKRQHRRAGKLHGEALDLEALLDALPDSPACEVDVEVALRLRRRSREDLEEESLAWIADLPAEHPERDELAMLLRDAEDTGCSWNGSLLLSLRVA